MNIDPDALAKSGTEHGHQTALMQWVALTGKALMSDLDMLFAVPNGGDRRLSVAAAMKAEGVRAGVPDLCWPVPHGVYFGLWIEMKRPELQNRQGGGCTPEQLEWHSKLRTKGHAVVIAYGWKCAAWALRKYSAHQLHMPLELEALRVTSVLLGNGDAAHR